MRSFNMAACIACAILAAAQTAAAQSSQGSGRPFEITDNSFLVEEAFNQEAGIFQNILVAQRSSNAEWALNFTQEWPVGGVRHQLSYTIAATNWSRGVFALNYRFQLREEDTAGPAISPRLSLLIPPGQRADRQAGLQFNLPLSRQFGDFYLHVNGGYTLNGIGSNAGTSGQTTAAASVIYRALPMFHLMLESAFATNQYGSHSSLLVSPGFRAGINFGRKQFVYGVAIPLGVMKDDDRHALLGYLSYELPF